MTHEDALLQAMMENPGDDTPRLVYADWLEERGDPRSRAVRKHSEVPHFLSALRQAAGDEAPLRQLEAWVFGGRSDLVRDLRLILACHPVGTRPPLRIPGAAKATLERVRRALCPLPDADKAASVIRRLGVSPPKPGEIPEQASRLASRYGPDVLLAVLERYQGDGPFLEFLACLAQEMVLRGVMLSGVPAAESVAASLREQGHPLARLPLFLTAAEGDLRPWLPRYGREGGEAWSTPYGLSREARILLPVSTSGASIFEEVTDPAVSDRIRESVRNWQEESNGQVEARVLRTSNPLDREHLSTELLRSLGLVCLEGAGEDDLRAERVTARDAFATLFSAASAGGAYNRGRRGAYGRRAAWQSFAGLAGVEGDGVEEVAEHAGRCVWLIFEAGSPWYYQVAWDIGVLAVRPDGMSLAVLAATDTD